MSYATIVKIRKVQEQTGVEYLIESEDGQYRMKTSDGSRVAREFRGNESTIYLHAVVDGWTCTLGKRADGQNW